MADVLYPDPWEEAQVFLKAQVDEDSYKNWFSHTRFGSFNDGVFVLIAPSRFFARWLQDHYLDAIHDSVKQVLPSLSEIRFAAANDIGIFENRDALKELPLSSPRRRQSAFPPNAFNSRYTFDRFVVGSGNRFAFAAARAVAESPARAYNPLFLYGPTGLGKTHLMQAIGKEILARWRDTNVVYVSSEDFASELIDAIAEKSTSKFRAKYREVDVLLIDDIHFIQRKEATQEEFFHTFNELFDMHKQIILSSDCGPNEMQGLESRLVSRFQWGLISDIQPPDMETRVAILRNKGRDEGGDVSVEVLNYIATCITSNIRELEGALVTAVAYAKLTGKPLTVPMAEEVLRDLIGNAKMRPITVETIQRAVAEHFDLRIVDLRGRSRERGINHPRQLAMYMTKQLISSMSLKEIGEAFGGKHHTTVLYACREISMHRDKDESTRRLLSQLKQTICSSSFNGKGST